MSKKNLDRVEIFCVKGEIRTPDLRVMNPTLLPQPEADPPLAETEQKNVAYVLLFHTVSEGGIEPPTLGL